MTMVWPVSSTSPAPSSAMTASVSTTCFTQTTMFISSLSPVYGLLRVILRKVLYAQHHYSPAFVRTIRTYLSICPKMAQSPDRPQWDRSGLSGSYWKFLCPYKGRSVPQGAVTARNQWPPERGSAERPDLLGRVQLGVALDEGLVHAGRHELGHIPAERGDLAHDGRRQVTYAAAST